MTTSSEFSKSQIALACWRATKDELYTVALAVACVLRNRANAGWFDGDLYTNACAELAENSEDVRCPDLRDPQFVQLLARLDSVTSGLAKDVTDGALWYCPKDQLPEKIDGKITATFGNMCFIR